MEVPSYTADFRNASEESQDLGDHGQTLNISS